MQTNAVTGYSSSSSTTTASSMNELTSEDFFNLLVTELKQQDPLEPTKTADMISQVSQIRSIELSKNLTDALTSLSQQQHTSGTAELLGKYVTATVADSNGDAQEVSGVVTGVRFDSDGSAVLELDTGESVPAESVTRITSSQNAAGQTTAKVKASTKNSTTTSTVATDQTSTTTDQPSTTTDEGLLPWLSLNGSFNL